MDSWLVETRLVFFTFESRRLVSDEGFSNFLASDVSHQHTIVGAAKNVNF